LGGSRGSATRAASFSEDVSGCLLCCFTVHLIRITPLDQTVVSCLSLPPPFSFGPPAYPPFGTTPKVPFPNRPPPPRRNTPPPPMKHPPPLHLYFAFDPSAHHATHHFSSIALPRAPVLIGSAGTYVLLVVFFFHALSVFRHSTKYMPPILFVVSTSHVASTLVYLFVFSFPTLPL